MSKNNLIDLYCFDHEIGRIGLDENAQKSFFQYNPEFLKSGEFSNLFPLVIKRIKHTHVFSQFNNESFRGLPPMIADSLPDAFGNTIFKTWLESKNRSLTKLSVLEQLTYVANRGMGALEYRPAKKIQKDSDIDINEIVEVLKRVLENKTETEASNLKSKALLNIFKIGTSAGGVRPKILVSENKSTGKIIPGDLAVSDDYHHYLIKLNLEEDKSFPRELIEYSYHQTAIACGINMMPSKLLDSKHFATLRYDRPGGKKIHTLSASGMTGWDYKDPKVSTYENLFDLAIFLKLPYKEIDELYKRMVFNLVFSNHDDHLKNHAFIYDEVKDRWHLAPAYDITYPLNPELNFTKVSRALSVNGKRMEIGLDDILSIAEKYTIKNPKRIIENIQEQMPKWEEFARNSGIEERVITGIRKEFQVYV